MTSSPSKSAGGAYNASEPGTSGTRSAMLWSQVATGANGKGGAGSGTAESAPKVASGVEGSRAVGSDKTDTQAVDPAAAETDGSGPDQVTAQEVSEAESTLTGGPAPLLGIAQYQHLLERISANELALGALASTVASLAEAVKALTPGSLGDAAGDVAGVAVTAAPPTASPLETPGINGQGDSNSNGNRNNTGNGAINGDGSLTPSLGSLVVQVAALSTSVAQLQRLQSGRPMRKSEDSLDSKSGARVERDAGPEGMISDGHRKEERAPATSGGRQDPLAAGQTPHATQSSHPGGWTSGPLAPNGRHDQIQPSASALSASASQNPALFAQQALHRQPNIGQPGPPPSGRQQISGRPAAFAPGGSAGPGGLGGLGSGTTSGLPSAATITRLSGYATNGGQASLSSNQHALGNLGMRSGPMRPGMGRSVSSSVILPNLGLTPSASLPSMERDHLAPSGSRGAMGGGGDGWPSSVRMGMKSPGLSGAPSAQNGQGGRGGDNASGTLTPGPGGLAVAKWDSLPLSPELLMMIAKYGIGPPNKVQARALPFMLKGSDIIAQAPPTQERIIAYVIPIIQLILNESGKAGPKGPKVVVITTTVDQANQANKLVRDLGAPLGIRTALVVGSAGGDLTHEVRNIAQNGIQVVVGTPAKVHDLFAGTGGVSGDEVRLLVLDEVDQMIARNLYEHVVNVVKVFPQPKLRNKLPSGIPGVIGTPAAASPGGGSSYDPGMQSPFNPASQMPFPAGNSKFTSPPPAAIERQTCLFSNTIPTDVISFSQSIQVWEPVRVLVRREGGAVNTSQDGPNSGHLRHYYLYLALAGATAGRSEQSAQGPGTIGSGRTQATGSAKSEASQAREYKLEALAGVLEDYPAWQAIIHVGSQVTLEAVVAKLNSRHFETVYLHPEMSPTTRNHTLAMWRASAQTARGPRFLVVFDLVVKPPEVQAAPLVVNFDLPRSVEAYAQRTAAAIQNPSSRQGAPAPSSVILNFIQAAGGDVEMLRSTECAYRFKCSEVPASLADLFN